MDRAAELPRALAQIASLGLALLSACSIGNPAAERQERATRLMACSLVMNTLSGARPAPGRRPAGARTRAECELSVPRSHAAADGRL